MARVVVTGGAGFLGSHLATLLVGRGDEVVATEVRALAHRTADAAKQIRQLITESSSRVAAGGAQVAEANARMTEALAAGERDRAALKYRARFPCTLNLAP